MNPTAPQRTSRNATKVCGLYTAGSIAVCRAGEVVALHIYTTEGEIVVRIAERDFIAGCRGTRDANGNPLRNFEDLDAETRRRVEEIQDSRRREQEAQLGMSATAADSCAVAWGRYCADDTLTQGAAAKLVGVSAATFNVWVRHNHGIEARELRLTRWGSKALRARRKRKEMPL